SSIAHDSVVENDAGKTSIGYDAEKIISQFIVTDENIMDADEVDAGNFFQITFAGMLNYKSIENDMACCNRDHFGFITPINHGLSNSAHRDGFADQDIPFL